MRRIPWRVSRSAARGIGTESSARKPKSYPRVLRALQIPRWACRKIQGAGESQRTFSEYPRRLHHRDINSATNILNIYLDVRTRFGQTGSYDANKIRTLIKETWNVSENKNYKIGEAIWDAASDSFPPKISHEIAPQNSDQVTPDARFLRGTRRTSQSWLKSQCSPPFSPLSLLTLSFFRAGNIFFFFFILENKGFISFSSDRDKSVASSGRRIKGRERIYREWQFIRSSGKV